MMEVLLLTMKINSVKQKYTNRGFTLLEILVALSIFAIISISCYKQIAITTQSIERMEIKYKALLVGSNAIEELFLDRKWPSTGETITEYNIDNFKWRVLINITDSDITNVRQIEAKVYLDDDNEYSIISLVRYIGKN